MLFYIVNLYFVTLLILLLKRYKKVKYCMPFVVLFLIEALRDETLGFDNELYKNYFIYYGNKSFIKLMSMRDGFYYVLNKFVLSIHGNFQLLLAIVAFLSLIGVFIFAKNSKSLFLSIWLFITMYYYQTEFTILRMAIALSLILIGLNYAIQDKWKKFLLYVFIATMFHLTAICCLIYYPIIKLRFRKKHLMWVAPLTMFLVIFKNQVVEIVWILGYKNFAYYSNTYGKQAGGEKLFLVYMLISIFIIFCECKLKTINEGDSTLQNLLVYCSILSVVAQSMAMVFPILNRMGYYFSLPMFLIFPNLFYEKFNKNSRRIAIGAIMLVTFVFYYMQLNSDNNVLWSSVPYKLMY